MPDSLSYISVLNNVFRIFFPFFVAGYRSPSSFSHIPDGATAAVPSSYTRGRSSLGHIYGGSSTARDIRRTPSTSAIYETLRRSRELRESLSRPSSRLSIDHASDKLRDSVSATCMQTSHG